MVSVSSRKFLMLWSSMTRVLEVLAPVMPSLKAPVILELSLRTLRFQWRMRGWNQPVSAATTGTMRMTTSASRQLSSSMAPKALSTYSTAQAISVKLQAILPAMRLVSFITRVMR